MASVQFKQGEDVKLSLLVLKNGVAVDCTTCPKIKVHLYSGTVLVKKYSLLEETDYGKLEVDSEVVAGNKINVYVERSESRLFPVGVIKAVLLASFVDTDFPDGLRVEQYAFTPAYCTVGYGLDENMD